MSPRINLLDWRARQLRRRGLHYQVAVTASLLIVLLLATILDVRLQADNHRRTHRNEQLQAAIAGAQRELQRQLEYRLQRESWLQQLLQVKDWQAQRYAAVHWLDELAHQHREGLRLQQIEQRGGELQLQGFSSSGEALAIYARQLEDSPWFTAVQLHSVHRDASAAAQFTMTLETRTWPESSASPGSSFDELMSP